MAHQAGAGATSMLPASTETRDRPGPAAAAGTTQASGQEARASSGANGREGGAVGSTAAKGCSGAPAGVPGAAAPSPANLVAGKLNFPMPGMAGMPAMPGMPGVPPPHGIHQPSLSSLGTIAAQQLGPGAMLQGLVGGGGAALASLALHPQGVGVCVVVGKQK